MGSLFNKAKLIAQQANGFNDKQYDDNNKISPSGIQYTIGSVIEDDEGSLLFIKPESYRDVIYPLNYATNVFKLAKNAPFLVALNHQLQLEMLQAVKEWGESDAATTEETLLVIAEKYPTAADYFEDNSMRAVFVKLHTNKEGAVVAEEVVEKGRALFAKTKR